ncbi:MAG: class I SAM-dependent methyltransferase [Planctomycetota bacterium]
MSPDASALALGRAWLAAQGCADGLVETIHARDEMYLTIADYPQLDAERQMVEYLRAGHEALTVLHDVLGRAGRTLGQLDATLEFACGYGRLTRFLVRELPPERLWSAEILPDAVAFVGATFGVHALSSATDPAQLRLPRRYPLIWVGSLFSHLPRPRFEAWLARLYDALDDDGLLVFSTHGADVIPEVPKDPSGFTFVPQSESLSLDAAEYGSAYVTPDVLREIAVGCGVHHLHGVERDLWWIQDVWVAAKRAQPGLERRTRAPVVRGAIDHLKIDAAGQAWVGGWTLAAASDAPVRSVSLLLDGRPIADAALGEPSTDQDMLPDCVHAAWNLHGSVAGLPPGRHVLAAVATAESGRPFCVDARSLHYEPGTPLTWSAA